MQVVDALVKPLPGQHAMISLAGRDILHGWGKFVLTGLGLGLLIGVTLTMAGVYRGMVDDAHALLTNSRADLWVVQKDTQGPYAESSSLKDDVVRSVRGMPGVAQAANVTYLTMQVRRKPGRDVRAMVVGIEPRPARRAGLSGGGPAHHPQPLRGRGRRQDRLCAGRAHPHPPPRLHRGGPDAAHGVVGRRPDGVRAAERRAGSAVSEGQRRHRQRPHAHRGQPGLQPPWRARPAGRGAGACRPAATTSTRCWCRSRPAWHAEQVAEPIRRWKHLQVFTRAGMEDILVAKLIATSAKQIGMFLVILAIVSAAIVAFIIYTMTLGKIREIAVLKLIGTRNRTIASMILQQALGLGLIGFVVGKVAATLWAPVFPKYVLLLPQDAVTGLVATLVICALASTLAIRVALKVDPAEAIG